MKLGLITDVHEDLGRLRVALSRLRELQVDRIVLLGDVVSMVTDLHETCRLLAEAQVVGVWGNHDFGLCVDPRAELRDRHGPVVINFMTSLLPRLEIEDCLFTHVEPWLDPNNLADLWYFDGIPATRAQLDRIFTGVSQRVLWTGHCHRWFLATPDGVCDWCGETAISLAQGRYFVIVQAVCEGGFATYDTVTGLLQPFRIEIA